MLKIYNSFSQQKEEFKPLIEGKVGLYVCGITVYDHCHLGHARTFVAFDMIVRYLRECGYAVTYVRNITDIDDKIIKRAADNNEDIASLTERFIAAMHQDERALFVESPTIEPRATRYIPQMIAMIEKLKSKGFAYVGKHGDVYFSTTKYKQYGELSQQNLAELQFGARVEVEEDKHSPLDFVLWKKAKAGEPSYESPWGAGRPGWHIECSAMSVDCLGETFDLHGGGHDLLFPHHENERAQAEASCGKKFVNSWMHVGFVQVDKEKMSKSLGNFFTIQEVLAEYSPEVVRYFLLSSNYRSQVNYSNENMQAAKGALDRLYTAIRGLEPKPNLAQDSTVKYFVDKFKDAMNDDFNTPEAISVLFEVAKEINKLDKAEQENKRKILANTLLYLANILGLMQQEIEAYFTLGKLTMDPKQIEELINQRNLARKEKDFKAADQIRTQLLERGVVLEDLEGKTTWRKEL